VSGVAQIQPSPLRSSLVALALLAAGTWPAQAQSFLFDFGAAANTTEHAATPDDPVNYWNNVTDTIGVNPAGQLPNLVTLDNTVTGLGLQMLSRFGGANTAGTTASTLFPTESTRDSLFGNTETFSGLANIFPSFKLTGLDLGSSYSFTFYASRTGVSDNRETGYTINGGNSGFTAFNAANNVDGISATVPGIVPTGSGEITISLAPTANNNNANHFTYLGVMRVDVVPEPSSWLLALSGVGLLLLVNRRRSS
jgi:hypothetical protein